MDGRELFRLENEVKQPDYRMHMNFLSADGKVQKTIIDAYNKKELVRIVGHDTLLAILEYLNLMNIDIRFYVAEKYSNGKKVKLVCNECNNEFEVDSTRVLLLEKGCNNCRPAYKINGEELALRLISAVNLIKYYNLEDVIKLTGHYETEENKQMLLYKIGETDNEHVCSLDELSEILSALYLTCLNEGQVLSVSDIFQKLENGEPSVTIAMYNLSSDMYLNLKEFTLASDNYNYEEDIQRGLIRISRKDKDFEGDVISRVHLKNKEEQIKRESKFDGVDSNEIKHSQDITDEICLYIIR